jgi:fermentation-respiration switch protein FrsA (DUF1100 family)
MLSPIINQFVYRPDVTGVVGHFTPAQIGLDFEPVRLETTDGVVLSAWYLPSAEPRLALLYCHGNAGCIKDWVYAAPPFVERGISVLVFDYRGYGASEGSPSERGLYRDGEAAWRWLSERAEGTGVRACVLGKSLGSAVAAHLGATERPAALVLDSAFTSMGEVALHVFPWIPKGLVPKLYESLSYAAEIHCPTLVIHGESDELVPLAQGRRLYGAIEGPKAMRVVSRAGHNDLDLHDSYWKWVTDFLLDPAGFTSQNRPKGSASGPERP